MLSALARFRVFSLCLPRSGLNSSPFIMVLTAFMRRFDAVRMMSGGGARSQHDVEQQILAVLRCFDKIDAKKVRLI